MDRRETKGGILISLNRKRGSLQVKYLPPPLSFRTEGSGGMERTVHEDSEEESRNLPPPWHNPLQQEFSRLRDAMEPRYLYLHDYMKLLRNYK